MLRKNWWKNLQKQVKKNEKIRKTNIDKLLKHEIFGRSSETTIDKNIETSNGSSRGHFAENQEVAAKQQMRQSSTLHSILRSEISEMLESSTSSQTLPMCGYIIYREVKDKLTFFTVSNGFQVCDCVMFHEERRGWLGGRGTYFTGKTGAVHMEARVSHVDNTFRVSSGDRNDAKEKAVIGVAQVRMSSI